MSGGTASNWRIVRHDDPLPANYPIEMVLRVARERSDTLGAAVDAIERGQDSTLHISEGLHRLVVGFPSAVARIALSARRAKHIPFPLTE